MQMPSQGAKLDDLKRSLSRTRPLVVAFSGGVDSAFLLAVARETLGEGDVLAVTVRSCLLPARETGAAVRFCRERSIRHATVDIDPLSLPGFAENPPDRCYICKKAIFSRVLELAASIGFRHVAEGSNLDDDDDYRPGRRAIAELGVLSPLRDAHFTKREIREESHKLGLETWDRPSLACLASRLPYGQRITAADLVRVDEAEQFLRESIPDIGQVRVRLHGGLARIEVAPEKAGAIVAVRNDVVAKFKSLGYDWTSLDLEGYRTGSMNDGLRN